MNWFRKLLGGNPGEPAPPASTTSRRIKYYTAETGYVYEYYVERSPSGRFTFHVSSNRSEWRPLTVLVSDEAVHPWEHCHGRTLRDQERYGAAKLALFAVFDESQPAALPSEIRLTAQEVETHLATLGV